MNQCDHEGSFLDEEKTLTLPASQWIYLWNILQDRMCEDREFGIAEQRTLKMISKKIDRITDA